MFSSLPVVVVPASETPEPLVSACEYSICTKVLGIRNGVGMSTPPPTNQPLSKSLLDTLVLVSRPALIKSLINNPNLFTLGKPFGNGTVVPAYAPATTIPATASQNTDGAVLGGQVGCNYQVTPGLVLGIETSGTADWAKDPTNGSVYYAGTQLGTLSTEVERTCQFRIGPRIGTTLPIGTGLAPLLYGTGGYEGACYKTTQSGQFISPLINAGRLTNTNVSSSDFESGWFVGGGVDMPTPFLIPSTFVQIEYSHAETNGSGVSLAGTTTTGKLENTTDELRVGFKYRFPVTSYAGMAF